MSKQRKHYWGKQNYVMAKPFDGHSSF